MFTNVRRTNWRWRRQFFLFDVTVVAFALIISAERSAARPSRVLLIHSFGNASPPSRAISAAFEEELGAHKDEPVDLDQVSLDMARYADRDMEEAIVDYLQKRQAKWQPDLVVTLGAPAALFVATYRARLFPEAPVLYTSLDRRFLPQGALETNAAYIGQVFDTSAWIEDMLLIAPATKNIEVVVGTTPLERSWQDAFQKTAEPFTGRIKFTYYNDLSFNQMLERAARLPPDSYIFFLLMRRDSLGVAYDSDEALQRLHEVANAPINSVFSYQLGLGIVGGRLYQSDRVGKEAARIAIRILHGEPTSNFPPIQIDPLPPHYDWRELRRWNIDEKRLPPGSTVLFRAPSLWEQHRALIMGGISVFVVQAGLIAAFLANLIRRRRAERSLAESEKRFRIAADAAPLMIWMTGPDKLCNFLNKSWFDFTGRSEAEEYEYGWVNGIHPEDLAHLLEVYEKSFDAREPFTIEFRLRRYDGEYRWVLSVGRPRFEAGVFLGYIGSCLDITERRQAELDHQLQSTELARVGRLALMGELAASLAHEVNNPLGAMVTNASAGQRLLAQGQLEPTEFQELLADIVSDGHRAREVIESIRNMVRKRETAHSPIRPKEIMQDLVRIVRADALARKINLVTEIGEKVGLVMGHRVQLLQVLLNLTMNAFEAVAVMRPESRRVTVRAENDRSGQICLSVRDSGPGFPDGVADQLFEPFFSTKKEGTGMGLTIARGIIEAHGGTLSGGNAPGGGALFSVCLPAAMGEESGKRNGS